MKKRLTIFFLSLFALTLLCSCGSLGESNQETDYIPKASEYHDDSTEPATENVPNNSDTGAEVEYLSCGDYKENLAWVRFKMNDRDYWGVIDKAGRMIFKLNADGVESVFPYGNGFSYVRYADRLDMLDTDGVIVSSYPIDEKRNVLACGDGYVFTQEDSTGFDSTNYICTIYDSTGSILNTTTGREVMSARYFGKGVFGTPNSIFFSKNNQWINDISYGYGDWDSHFDFFDNIASAKIDYYSPRDNGYRGKLVLLSSEGQSSEVELYPEMGWNWSIIGVKDGMCVLYERGDDYPILYNINTGDLIRIPDDYIGRTEWRNIRDTPPVILGTGKVAVDLRGDDGKKYVAVFDKEWNIVIDPIRSERFIYSENILISVEKRADTAGDTYIYDEDGKQIYTLSEKGYKTISPYSDSVACVSSRTLFDQSEMHELDRGTIPAYVDMVGNLIFDKIDMSATIDR